MANGLVAYLETISELKEETLEDFCIRVVGIAITHNATFPVNYRGSRNNVTPQTDPDKLRATILEMSVF